MHWKTLYVIEPSIPINTTQSHMFTSSSLHSLDLALILTATHKCFIITHDKLNPEYVDYFNRVVALHCFHDAEFLRESGPDAILYNAAHGDRGSDRSSPGLIWKGNLSAQSSAGHGRNKKAMCTQDIACISFESSATLYLCLIFVVSSVQLCFSLDSVFLCGVCWSCV